MTTKYSDSPVFRINKFIENKLRGINELNGSAVSGTEIIPPLASYKNDTDTDDEFVIPFLSPAAQLPEVITIYDQDTTTFQHLPFGVYSSRESKILDQPWKLCGQITYMFYFGGDDKLYEIASYINELCRREDWSAYDANYFYRNDTTFPFDFKTISFIDGSGPFPAQDEGGLSGYMCVIGYDATYEGTGRVGNYGNETSRGMR